MGFSKSLFKHRSNELLRIDYDHNFQKRYCNY